MYLGIQWSARPCRAEAWVQTPHPLFKKCVCLSLLYFYIPFITIALLFSLLPITGNHIKWDQILFVKKAKKSGCYVCIP